LGQLALPKERNRLKVDSTLAVADCTGVWALGDCALIPDVNGGFQPPTAQHASREGKIVARNIVAQSLG
jgi:NADH dehydrogenase